MLSPLKWSGYSPLTHECIAVWGLGLVIWHLECECSQYRNIWQEFWYSGYDDDGGDDNGYDDDNGVHRGGVK